MKRLMTHVVMMFPLVSGALAADLESLFEAGQFQQVVDAVTPDTAAPGDLYLAAQSYDRLMQPGEARAMYERLAAREDAWREVGHSAIALLEQNVGEALRTAHRATQAEPMLAEAHYQHGHAQAHKGDFAAAAAAFEKAASLDAGFAYAHYYAGLSYYRNKRIDLMARHFEAFLKLAPKAPERPEVESIMRTVRGR